MINNVSSSTLPVENNFVELAHGMWHNTTNELNFFTVILTNERWVQMEGENRNNTSNFMPLIQSIDKSVRGLRDDIYAQQKDINKLTGDFNVLKSDVVILKRDVQGLKEDVRDLKEDTRSLKSDVSEIKGDAKSLFTHIDGIDKRINDIHHSQTIGFTIIGLLITISSILIPVILSFLQKGGK